MSRPAAMLAALLGSACAGGVAGCPDDLPAQCPSPVPSYASAVRGLLDQACTSGCHQPGGVAADRPLGSHADVYRQRSAVLNQAYGCTMPPAGSAALTAAQRALLLGWLVCGAPDN